MITMNPATVHPAVHSAVTNTPKLQKQEYARVHKSDTMRDVSSGEKLFLQPFAESQKREIFKWSQLLGDCVMDHYKFERVENLITRKYEALLRIDSSMETVQVKGQKGVMLKHTQYPDKKVFVPILWSETLQTWYGHHMK